MSLPPNRFRTGDLVQVRIAGLAPAGLGLLVVSVVDRYVECEWVQDSARKERRTFLSCELEFDAACSPGESAAA